MPSTVLKRRTGYGYDARPFGSCERLRALHMSLHMNATGIHVRPTGRVIAPTKKNAVVPTARCGAPALR